MRHFKILQINRLKSFILLIQDSLAAAHSVKSDSSDIAFMQNVLGRTNELAKDPLLTN